MHGGGGHGSICVGPEVLGGGGGFGGHTTAGGGQSLGI